MASGEVKVRNTRLPQVSSYSVCSIGFPVVTPYWSCLRCWTWCIDALSDGPAVHCPRSNLSFHGRSLCSHVVNTEELLLLSQGTPSHLENLVLGPVISQDFDTILAFTGWYDLLSF